MKPPPYTNTDWGLALSTALTAVADLASMFVPLPIDRGTRSLIITALSAILGTLIVSFTGHRAAKHVVHALRH